MRRISAFPKKPLRYFSMFETTEGFILHRTVFRNTSYVVDVLTRRFGRMSFMVRGARGEKSQFLGTLEFLNKISLTFRNNEAAELQTLRSADVINDAFFLAESSESYEMAGEMVKLIRKIVPEREPHENIYHIIDMFLKGMRAGKGQKALIYCLIKLADALGWTLSMNQECRCGDTSALTWFDVQHGSFSCDDCKIGVYASDLYAFVRSIEQGDAREYTMSNDEFVIYHKLLLQYFEVHTR